MGGLAPNAPAIKGAACQALDALSTDRTKLEILRSALGAIKAASYQGLENVLGQHLLPAKFDAAETAKIVAHLRDCWFNVNSPKYFFPGTQSTAEIYGQGLTQTLILSLSGSGTPLPIDSWWLLDHTQVELLNFKTPRQVTLMIATPRPGSGQPLDAGHGTVALSTRSTGGRVTDHVIETTRR